MSARRDVIGYLWVPEGDTSPYWTLADHSDSLTVIAPTWLSFDATGALTSRADKRLLRFARSRGLRVTPLVANSPFKPETARPIFKDADSVERNVAKLLAAVKDLGADGINVDIEGVAPEDRPLYNVFIAALAEVFHKENLSVTVDLPAKTSDAPSSAWAGWADYAWIGKHVDQAHLMCYDEHWSAGPPGPVASLPWVRKVLDYAVTQIPRKKIVLGVPFYGYDWPPEGTASEVTGSRARELLSTSKAKPERDAESGSLWFHYTDPGGIARTVWYEDEESLKGRLSLAREFGLAGVSIWRLGDETPGFWPILRKYRSGR
jgi:spore germination protein YaaH